MCHLLGLELSISEKQQDIEQTSAMDTRSNKNTRERD